MGDDSSQSPLMMYYPRSEDSTNLYSQILQRHVLNGFLPKYAVPYFQCTVSVVQTVERDEENSSRSSDQLRKLIKTRLSGVYVWHYHQFVLGGDIENIRRTDRRVILSPPKFY